MPRKPNASRQTKALLACFLEAAQEWRHGYDLAKAIGLKSGSLYPILMRLSDQGYLESQWCAPDRPGRPPRHAYRLTGEGRKLAMEQAATAQASSTLYPSGLPA